MAPPHDSSSELSPAPAPAVVTVDVTAARDLIASAGHRYLDVRTAEELSKGHLENSLNVPYMFITPQGREKNPAFVEQVASLFTKEEHVVVGFKNVKNMGGGYTAWVDKGFPVHNATPAPTA